MTRPSKGSVVVLVGTTQGRVRLSKQGREWNLMADLLPPILSVETAVV